MSVWLTATLTTLQEAELAAQVEDLERREAELTERLGVMEATEKASVSSLPRLVPRHHTTSLTSATARVATEKALQAERLDLGLQQQSATLEAEVAEDEMAEYEQASKLPRHCHVTDTSLPRHCHVTDTSLTHH